ncbi:DUF2397 family protein [bacterium]|nr:DUF2397 family protein [bacterium]
MPDLKDETSAASLVLSRNHNLGHLLTAERAVWYVQILYQLLIFRRAHELAPLHEDVYEAVHEPLGAFQDDGAYTQAQYANDIRQLLEWDLIEERIELERLRGYKDTRRRKFRYRLTHETRAFLEWLEDRARDDLEDSGADTRNLLETVLSSLNELNRVLHRVGTKRTEEGDARRVLHQLTTLDQLTHSVTENLVTFNERMYGFLLAEFEVAEARQIIDELQVFVDQFLHQIYRLREDITGNLGRIGDAKAFEKIQLSIREMDRERKQAAHLLRRSYNDEQVTAIPAGLQDYYREDGQLDELCRRISHTAQLVWKRLYLRLRERERKSHRLEDLRARIAEIASLPPDVVPHRFLYELIAPAQIAVDPNHWTALEKADPPQPRLYRGRQRERAVEPLRVKQLHPESARELEQQKLDRLVSWLRDHVLADGEDSARLCDGRFETLDDLAATMQLVKAGLLNRGRKLSISGFRFEQRGGQDELVAGDYRLELDALNVHRKQKDEHGHAG